MKKQIFNRSHVEGYLYQHKLEKKVTGAQSKNPNTPYINGTIDIATDDEMTNIVTIHFTYTTPTTKGGGENRTFKTLANIIDGTICSVMEHGRNKANKLSVDTAIDVNEWYSDRNGEEELVSTMRNEGGFITLVDSLNEDPKTHATFDTDILLYKVNRLEADEEKELKERVILNGYVMNFRQDFLPVKYTVYNPNAMNYFEDLDVSEKNPVFTRVRGVQVSTIVVRKVEEEGAFGEAYVREYTNSHRDFVVNWAKKDPYEIGEDADLSAAEIKKGLADRQTALATRKKEREEYLANRNATTSASAFANNDDDEYNF